MDKDDKTTTEDKSATLEKEYRHIFGKDKSGKTRVWKATVFSFKVSNTQLCILNAQSAAHSSFISSPSESKIRLCGDLNVKMCTAMSVIQHGIYDGKLQVDSRQYTEGKNIGKKNETTPLQQCIAEVEKKRKDKIEKE